MYWTNLGKRLICIITILCVGVVFTGSNLFVYASENSIMTEQTIISEAVTLSESNQNIDEYFVDDAVAHIYLAMDEITSVSKNKSNELELEAEIGTSNATITIVEANNEGATLEVDEDNKHNVIHFDSNGDIYLNGAPVYFVYEDKEAITLDYTRVNNTTTCPYDKASAYTKVKLDGKKLGYINLSSGAVTLGTAALGLILVKYFPVYFGEVSTYIIPAVLSYWAGENVDPKYISVRAWEYVHATKGFMVSASKGVYKRTIKMYPTKNYSGKAKNTKTSYRVYYY